MERDEFSNNVYGNYYQDYIDEINESFIFEPSEYIYVYKLEFSIFFMEEIILNYLYEHIKIEYNFFYNILDRGGSGGLFEILVDYYIRCKKNFLIKNINNTFYISAIVPQSYSIKNYSYSRRKNNNFKEYKLINTEKKRKIPFENTYIKQTIFNSKYYNMAILKKEKEPNIFSLCSIQAIIKKDKEKRMTKDEHELILGAVKRNIENEFDIIIQKAYFFYVLSKKKWKYRR